MRRISAEADKRALVDISCSGRYCAAFTLQGWDDYENEHCHVCLFKLGQQEPVQVLQQDPPARPYQTRHCWSPDQTQLAVWWDHKRSLQMALLSQDAVAELQARPLCTLLPDASLADIILSVLCKAGNGHSALSIELACG